MKLFEVANGLIFYQDNPGGSWLKNKREYNSYHDKTEFGLPKRMGPITGSFNRPVLIPVHLASTVKGARGEQSNVRDADLDALVRIMGETNKLPLENGKQYAPFVTVDQEGVPWVNEGNHRIMAAKKLGWEYIPVEVRYFTGGEDVDGPFAPSKLKAFDSAAISKGFKPGNEFTTK